MEKFKYGGIYWPLAPYTLAVNDLALHYEGKFYAIDDELKASLSQDDHRTYDDYRKHFLIDPTPPVEGVYVSKTDCPPPDPGKTCNLMFEKLDRLVKNDPPKRTRFRSAMKYYPQSMALTPNLAISKRWKTLGLKNGQFFSVMTQELLDNEHFNSSECFYVCADKVVFDYRSPDEVSHSFYNLFDFDVTVGHLPDFDAEYDREKLAITLISSSFFGDTVPDVVLALVTKRPRRRKSADADEFHLGPAFNGLSQLLLIERRAWLDSWSFRLGSEIDTVLTKGKTEAAKFAATAIGRMAEALTFSPLESSASFQSALMESFCKDEADIAEGEGEFERAYETIEGPTGARAIFVRKTLSTAFDKARRHILGRDGRVLKGLLSIPVNSQLRKYATNAPQSARMVLRGDPGGGKGAAAKEYHRLAMNSIFDTSFSSSFSKLTEPNYTTADMTEFKRTGWYRFLRKVAHCVGGIFALPHRKVKDPDWFLSQIDGARWWTWSRAPRDETRLGKGFSQSRSTKLRKVLEGIEELFEFNDDSYKFGSENRNARASDLAEYMYRLMAHIATVGKDSDDNDWNLFQIACGSLGGEGAELGASLRQLFGYAPRRENEYGAPGLFQVCSYVGGTLFLDEVADAPIRIQDNLLVPLEEQKVYREGWETTSEDVSTIRVISATHKDLNEAVEEYKRTVNEAHPRGFRPDLLTRLASTAPIQILPVSEYFNYVFNDQSRDRTRYREEFARILSGNNANETSFWVRVYDRTDQMLDRFVENLAMAGSSDRRDERRAMSRKISMRFFMNIKSMRKECGRDPEALERLEPFVLSEHIPNTLRYLLNG